MVPADQLDCLSILPYALHKLPKSFIHLPFQAWSSRASTCSLPAASRGGASPRRSLFTTPPSKSCCCNLVMLFPPRHGHHEPQPAAHRPPRGGAHRSGALRARARQPRVHLHGGPSRSGGVLREHSLPRVGVHYPAISTGGGAPRGGRDYPPGPGTHVLRMGAAEHMYLDAAAEQCRDVSEHVLHPGRLSAGAVEWVLGGGEEGRRLFAYAGPRIERGFGTCWGEMG